MQDHRGKWGSGGLRCRWCGGPTHPLNKPGAWPRLAMCCACGKVLWPDGTPKNPVEGRLERPAQWCLDELSDWENGYGGEAPRRGGW